MTSFESALQESFVHRMVLHLLEDFPEDLRRQKLASEDLESLVQDALLRAEALGITREDYLRLFVECLAILGPQFDSDNPVTVKILTGQDLSVDEKMEELNSYLLFGLGEPK
jgi:hypothetical protein